MSANSDTKKLLDYAEEAGLTVEKAKHGSYRILNGEETVVYVRAGGHQPPHWIQKARRCVEKAVRG